MHSYHLLLALQWFPPGVFTVCCVIHPERGAFAGAELRLRWLQSPERAAAAGSLFRGGSEENDPHRRHRELLLPAARQRKVGKLTVKLACDCWVLTSW